MSETTSHKTSEFITLWNAWYGFRFVCAVSTEPSPRGKMLVLCGRHRWALVRSVYTFSGVVFIVVWVRLHTKGKGFEKIDGKNWLPEEGWAYFIKKVFGGYCGGGHLGGH